MADVLAVWHAPPGKCLLWGGILYDNTAEPACSMQLDTRCKHKHANFNGINLERNCSVPPPVVQEKAKMSYCRCVVLSRLEEMPRFNEESS